MIIIDISVAHDPWPNLRYSASYEKLLNVSLAGCRALPAPTIPRPLFCFCLFSFLSLLFGAKKLNPNKRNSGALDFNI